MKASFFTEFIPFKMNDIPLSAQQLFYIVESRFKAENFAIETQEIPVVLDLQGKRDIRLF